MGIKPLVVASRYKALLVLPFLLIIPVAAGLSILNIKTTYTSTARLLVQESPVLDSLVDGNPYASPAQNRANDIIELMQTEKFRYAVAQKIEPDISREDAGALMYEVGNGTAIYTGGRRLLVVSHTSTDITRPRIITDAIVEAFKEDYRATIGQKAQIVIDAQNHKLLDDQQARNDVVARRDAYLRSFTGDASKLATDAQYQSFNQDIQRLDDGLQATRSAIQSAIQSRDTAARNQDDYSIKTQDDAEDPAGKDAVSKKQLIALPVAGLLIALSLSAALYAFLFRTDNRIRTVEDLKSLPGVLLLGTVPDAAPVRKRSWPRNFFRIAVAGLGVTASR